jgi:hypothetical protein
VTRRRIETLSLLRKYCYLALRGLGPFNEDDVPDSLYRQAKAEAALRGRKLTDLVEEGLRLILEAPPETRRRPDLAGLTKHALGVIESGIPELGSNPKHLNGFAWNASDR